MKKYWTHRRKTANRLIVRSGGWQYEKRTGFVYANAETGTLIAAMTTAPTQARVTLIDNCIQSLKDGGVWSLLDILQVYAAHDSQAALLWWNSPTTSATAVSSPTFTTDKGFTGNGTSSYVDTTYNTSTGGNKFTTNSNFMGVWVLTAVTGNNSACGGVNTRITPRAGAGTFLCRSNNATAADYGAIATSVGFSAFSRTSSSNMDGYKNGSLISSVTRSVTSMDNLSNFVCASNNATFYTGQVAAFCAGASLSAAQHATLHNALNTYLTGVGAV